MGLIKEKENRHFGAMQTASYMSQIVLLHRVVELLSLGRARNSSEANVAAV